MKVTKKSTGKGTTTKGPPTGSDGNLHKRIESERIASDIADYEKSGGKVEKLGVTRVLQTVAPAQKGEVPKSEPTVRPRSR
jgi:nucleoid-associated protein YgaU